MFDSSSDDSPLSEIDDDFEGNDTSVLCPKNVPGYYIDSEDDVPDCDDPDNFENTVIDEDYATSVSWTSDFDNAFSFNKFDGSPGPIHDLPPGSAALDYF